MKKSLNFFFRPKHGLQYLPAYVFTYRHYIFTDKLTKPLQKVTGSIIIPLQKGINGIGSWLTEKKICSSQ